MQHESKQAHTSIAKVGYRFTFTLHVHGIGSSSVAYMLCSSGVVSCLTNRFRAELGLGLGAVVAVMA